MNGIGQLCIFVLDYSHEILTAEMLLTGKHLRKYMQYKISKHLPVSIKIPQITACVLRL